MGSASGSGRTHAGCGEDDGFALYKPAWHPEPSLGSDLAFVVR